MRARLFFSWVVALTLVSPPLLCLISCQGINPVPVAPQLDSSDLARMARLHLADAHELRAAGDLEGAEREARRAVELTPQDPRAQRLLAGILDEGGQRTEAGAHWVLAQRLDPRSALPNTPLGVDAHGVWVALVGPSDPDVLRSAARRPDRELEAKLVGERIRLRLPDARVVVVDPATVREARAWIEEHEPRVLISLAIDRAFCTHTRKDGEFALASLRVAVATAGAEPAPVLAIREIVDDPIVGPDCVPFILATALERTFADPALRAALGTASGGSWTEADVRGLFPGLTQRIAGEIDSGRAQLTAKQYASALDAFERALLIDPEDAEARAYRHEAEENLAIDAALSNAASEIPETPETRSDEAPSVTKRAITEAQLEQARRRRVKLLEALLFTQTEERTPSRLALMNLEPVDIADPSAVGPRLARAQTRSEIEARALFDGAGRASLLYFFPVDEPDPVLRAEDGDADGRSDRWIGYRHGLRTELWEDRIGLGRPGLHVVFAADGLEVVRVEVDADADDRVEQIFRYDAGRLVSEQRDTNGDGRLDRVETFDENDGLAFLSEDLNGDGLLDVRTIFRNGKIVSREISNPAVVEGLISN